MRHRQRTQNALSVVSYLFLFVGLIALTEMVVHAVTGTFRFNFGILGIGIYAGLRRYSRIWRWCALLFTWYGMIALSYALFICLYSQPASKSATDLGQQLSGLPASIPANWLSIPLIMVLLVTLWQYRVLTHPAIRRLFIDEPRPANLPESAPVGAEIDGAVLK
jgi:hypothetical protein